MSLGALHMPKRASTRRQASDPGKSKPESLADQHRARDHMPRYKNESPSPEQQKFINLLALGEVSQGEAHKLAGYSGDRANAARLAKKFAAEIAIAREKLGLPPKSEAEPEVIDDEDVRALVEQNRSLYAAAIAAGDIKSARKSLTAIERLLKKKHKRATVTTPTVKPASTNMFAHLSSEQLWELAYDLTETDEDRKQHADMSELWADYETQRGLMIQGLPNRFSQTPFPGATTRVLPGGTQVIDIAEPDAEDSPVAMTPEVVRRL